jgi:hypothetical protein
MSALVIAHQLATSDIVEALAAASLGEPVLIRDDLADGGSVTVAAAGRRRWSDQAVAMAMPRWRAEGPQSVPAGVTTIQQVSDLGLVVDADLATASVDLLRLAGADPVVLHLDATVEPSVEVSLSAVLQAWCLGCACRATLDDALRNVERAGAGSVLLIRAGRSELAAPGACAQWSRNDPASALRQGVLRGAALISVMDHQRRRPGGDTSSRCAPA